MKSKIRVNILSFNSALNRQNIYINLNPEISKSLSEKYPEAIITKDKNGDTVLITKEEYNKFYEKVKISKGLPILKSDDYFFEFGYLQVDGLYKVPYTEYYYIPVWCIRSYKEQTTLPLSDKRKKGYNNV